MGKLNLPAIATAFKVGRDEISRSADGKCAIIAVGSNRPANKNFRINAKVCDEGNQLTVSGKVGEGVLNRLKDRFEAGENLAGNANFYNKVVQSGGRRRKATRKNRKANRKATRKNRKANRKATRKNRKASRKNRKTNRRR
jgi:hypothetical protein